VDVDGATGIGGLRGQADLQLGERLIGKDICNLPGSDWTGLVGGANGLQWPLLSEVGLGAAQLRSRMSGIGGSDANTILSGAADQVMALWREKRGDVGPDDLSGRLPVALGSWTEPFNRQWYEKLTGSAVTGIGRSVQCQHDAWRRCTLDGYVEASNAVFEGKHASAFTKSEEMLERYMPQLQHNMAVVKAERAVLSVIFGNHKFEIFEIAADWLYQLDLLEAEQAFWDCVQTGTEPVPAPVPDLPRSIGVREVCLDGSNAWAVAAADWLEYQTAAKTHAAACTAIKSLVDDHVARAFDHGIEAKRSKAGALNIRELVR
jgi:hypothetical protein